MGLVKTFFSLTGRIKMMPIQKTAAFLQKGQFYCVVVDGGNHVTVQTGGISNPVYAPAEPAELDDVARNLRPTYNFAAYVNNSKTLQQLVDLGVDLFKIEKRRDLTKFVLQLDFDRHVKPYVLFLHDRGVPAASIGAVLTKNILICNQQIEDLDVRLNYLESKKFTKDMISAIIVRNPTWLTTPVEVIDKRLGWFQATFKLSGDEIRDLVNNLPQIATFSLETIKLNKFVLEEEMGIPKGMVKDILKKRPRILIKNQLKLLQAFEYIHNTMKVPQDVICHQPDILMEREHKIRERHLFLQRLGRAQYNPRLPGYISLDALIKSDDVEFCNNIAKSSIDSFNSFLKTL